jgi:hypothetical protein
MTSNALLKLLGLLQIINVTLGLNEGKCIRVNIFTLNFSALMQLSSCC